MIRVRWDSTGLALMPRSLPTPFVVLTSPRGSDSVQQRNPVIQQGDVRTVLAGQANGLLPVGRLTGDLKPFLLQEQSDALPDDLVVVSQKNARRHLDTSLTGSGEGGNPESPSNRTRKIPNGAAGRPKRLAPQGWIRPRRTA